MFFISENGAVIYKVINFTIIEVLISIFFKSCKLFKFKSKDKQFDYLWRKSAYILKETSEAFKQDAYILSPTNRD